MGRSPSLLGILCHDEERAGRGLGVLDPKPEGTGCRTPPGKRGPGAGLLESEGGGGWGSGLRDPRGKDWHLDSWIAVWRSHSHSVSKGGDLDARGDPLPPAPPPPADPTPQSTSPPRSPAANSGCTGFSRRGKGRGAGPASWEPTWDSGAAPPALTQDEGAWPLRVTLLQSSF